MSIKSASNAHKPALTEVISRHKPDGTYFYASHGCEVLKGYTSEQLIGTSPYDYIVQEDKTILESFFAEISSGEYTSGIRLHYYRPDGSIVAVESSAQAIFDKGMLKEVIVFSKPVHEPEGDLHVEASEPFLGHASHEYLFVLSEEGAIEFCNIDDRSQWIGNHYEQLVSQEDSQKGLTYIKIALANQKSYFFYNSIPIGAGDLQPCTCKVTPVVKANRRSKLVITCTPMHEPIALIKNYGSTELRYRQIVESAKDLIYTCDFQGYFTYVNPYFAERLQRTTQSLLNQHFTTVIRSDYAEHVAKFYQEQFQQRIPSTYVEFPVITQEKETVWIGQNVQMILEGEWIIGFQAVARDISEQIEMEEALRTSEIRNRALLNSIPDMMFRLDKSGKILDFRAGAMRPFYEKEELIGNHLSEMDISSISLKKLLRGIEAAITSDRPQVVEYQYSFKGEKFTYDARIVKINDNEVISTVRNMTAKKKVEKELIEARKNAEESSKTKEQFLSIMSHEIRTPLNAIVGLTNLLKEKEPTEDQLEFIDGIKYSSDNLLKLVNDILDFTKIESRKLILENTEFNLEELLKGVIQTTVAGYPDSKNKISYEIDERIPPLLSGDPVRLNQILTNLVSNALKFTKEGRVAVQVSQVKADAKYVELSFQVEDTGIGIPADRLPSIFDSFTQANIDTTRKYGGTGLGLTITKQLVELQGGKIQAHSIEEEGSTFSFTITFEQLKRKRKTPVVQPQPDLTALKKLRVLIAEDNEMNQLVMSKYLDNWGVQYEIAEDGIEAIKLVRQDSFDLVLLDLEMPRLDGYESAKLIRSEVQPDKDLLPIIAISASTLASIKRKATKAGIDDFISKPVDYNILQEKLLKYAGIKGVNTLKESPSESLDGLSFNLINLSYLRNSSLNDEKYMTRMVQLFLRNTPQYIKDIKKLQKDGNLQDLKILAHKFKASINIMGIQSVGKLIYQLEDSIEKNRKLDQLPTLISGIEIYSLASCAELEVLLLSGQLSNSK